MTKRKTVQVVWGSRSRERIAEIADQIFMKVVRLFDLSSIDRFDRWFMHYVRIKIVEKMQTLFSMGKINEFMELLDFVEEKLPEVRELAKRQDVWINVRGRQMSKGGFNPEWIKGIPRWVIRFMKSPPPWKCDRRLE